MMSQIDEKLARAWSLVVAMAWDDEEFEGRIFDDPRQALLEQGMELPASLAVRVVREEEIATTEGELLLPYPSRPTQGELSDDELEAVAGGTGPLVMMDSSGLGELTALRSVVQTRLLGLNPVELLRPDLLRDS